MRATFVVNFFVDEDPKFEFLTTPYRSANKNLNTICKYNSFTWFGTYVAARLHCHWHGKNDHNEHVKNHKTEQNRLFQVLLLSLEDFSLAFPVYFTHNRSMQSSQYCLPPPYSLGTNIIRNSSRRHGSSKLTVNYLIKNGLLYILRIPLGVFLKIPLSYVERNEKQWEIPQMLLTVGMFLLVCKHFFEVLSG